MNQSNTYCMITVMGNEEKTGVNKQEIRKVDTSRQ